MPGKMKEKLIKIKDKVFSKGVLVCVFATAAAGAGAGAAIQTQRLHDEQARTEAQYELLQEFIHAVGEKKAVDIMLDREPDSGIFPEFPETPAPTPVAPKDYIHLKSSYCTKYDAQDKLKCTLSRPLGERNRGSLL